MSTGPIYDNVLRLLAVTDLEVVCGWLGVRPVGEPVRVSEALPSSTQHADLVVRIGRRGADRPQAEALDAVLTAASLDELDRSTQLG